MGRLDLLRTRVADLHGARPAEAALLPSTSAALSVVAESVDRRGRNRVVCTELDFPTLVYQWRVKPEIELVVLESPDLAGRTRLARHRAVHEALGREIMGRLHALALELS